MPTTITVDPKIRDRLKLFGHAGMTYNEILTRMMDQIDERAFVTELRRRASMMKDEDWVELDDV